MKLEDVPTPIADSFTPNLWANWAQAFKQVRESHRQTEKRLGLAVAALKGLLADITEYQTINKLGGENNHWQRIARETIAQIEEGK